MQYKVRSNETFVVCVLVCSHGSMKVEPIQYSNSLQYHGPEEFNLTCIRIVIQNINFIDLFCCFLF